MKPSATAMGICLVVMAARLLQAAPPETVTVTHPGNTADATGYGAVAYTYRIGKYEVTNAEYGDFLNAVAGTDTHRLYDPRMAGEYGGILRSGSPGSYAYRTKDGMAGKPVNYVTWVSCVRYANWLSNGQGAGDTENGTYEIAPGDRVTRPDHAKLAAGKATRWVLASEDEWYKAAYYDPRKTGGAGYEPYALKGGSAPDCNLNSNQPSDVGCYASAPSPCGTFDQNGNMWEYNETVSGDKVGLRGGSFYLNDHKGYLRASTRYDVLSAKWPNYGFRVVALGSGPPAPTRKSRPAVPVPRTRPAAAAPSKRAAKTFYVSQSEGNDDWTGESLTPREPTGPWKTLMRASTQYVPGDALLMKRGDTWHEGLSPKGSGTRRNPITISAYGEGNKPVIDREDDRQDRYGIYLNDQEGIKIIGIEFNRCMTGIYAEYSNGCPTKKVIWIEDCYFHDSLKYQHYEDYPKRKIGLGVCFFTYERDKRIVLTDIMIRNCVFRRLASAVWTNNPDNFNKNASFVYNFGNLIFDGCLFEEGYQWQQGIRGVDKGAMRNCVTHDIGRGFRSFNGVAGSMFFRCRDWVFENCEWGFVSIGQGSGDGEAFDFEGNCDNMTMRNCLFHDTDGPGFLMCCYASDGHANTGIRMENCVLNGKAKRPIGLPRCEIVNTTDWTESTWHRCRFYLSPGETLMKVMDPEKDKKTRFVDCEVTDLSQACGSPNLARRAKAKASSQKVGSEASRATDGNAATAWTATSPGDQWLQLAFPSTQTINAFRISEDPDSSVIRYEIQCWDDKAKKWIGCFNGRTIGPNFIAPIVSRKTRGVRLHIMRTTRGNPAIKELGVYNGTGQTFNDPNGMAARQRVGK